MHGYRTHVVALASLSLGLLAAAPARAASLQAVSNWGASGVPSYMQMNIYVPDKMATKPPIMVSAHACGSTASGQMGNIKTILKAADAQGFILILPDNSGNNCWDVGSAKALKHDGGGDTQGIAQMVKYALTKYNGDPARVYMMGGSSGAMLTQAMMATYPELFMAGHARAGVPAGCWADGYASSNQWSNNCAGGSVTKTAMQWGDLARGMDPGYTGHRPRLQIMQGKSDTTISYKNFAEGIKQWTNVFGLAATPTLKDTMKGTVTTYDRQSWKNACGVSIFEAMDGPGTHSMAYEEEAILAFFGLDQVGAVDPETACAGGGAGGGSGAGGAKGNGGATGAGGTVGSGGGTGSGGNATSSGGGTGSGGDVGSGGSTSSSGGTVGSGSGGNVSSSGGTAETGGSQGSGGVKASGGSQGSGGSNSGSGGSPGSGGSNSGSGSGGSGSGSMENGSSGGCSVGGGLADRASTVVATLLLAVLGLTIRRHRRSRR